MTTTTANAAQLFTKHSVRPQRAYVHIYIHAKPRLPAPAWSKYINDKVQYDHITDQCASKIEDVKLNSGQLPNPTTPP